MLRFVHLARFAFQHSPEKEQRLLAFAAPANPNAPDEENAPIEPPGLSEHEMDAFIAGVELSKRQKFHDAIFNAIDEQAQRQVLQEYRPQIEKRIGLVDDDAKGKELNDVLEQTRVSIIADLNREETERNELAKKLGDIDTNALTDDALQKLIDENKPLIKKYFVIPKTLPAHGVVNLLQALLAKDVERVRQQHHKETKGIKWDFMRNEEFETLYRRIKKIPANEKIAIPSSFSDGTTMFFNIDHDEFWSKETGGFAAKKAVVREATNLALSNAEPRYGIDVWTRMIRSHPLGKELASIVEKQLNKNPAYAGSVKKDNQIVREALSIFIVHEKYPEVSAGQKDDERKKYEGTVVKIMQTICNNPQTQHVRTMNEQLKKTVDQYLEVEQRNGDPEHPLPIPEMLIQAKNDRKVQQKILSDLPTEEEAKKIAEKELERKKKEAEGKLQNPTEIISKVDMLLAEVDKLRVGYPELRKTIQHSEMDAEKKEELNAIIDENMEYFSDTATKLLALKHKTDILRRWNLSEHEGGLSIEEKSNFAQNNFTSNPYQNLNPGDYADAADRACEKNRAQSMEEIRECLPTFETVLEEIAAELKEANNAGKAPKTKAAEETDETVWQWVRKNVLSSQGSVVYLTPLNVKNIVKTYLDAITQNYTSNQKVKENRIAKQLNFYSPIQHTLNKLARSTNNTESSEFKEYIEREGFTFEEVFGKDGKGKSTGLLYENRHNFNRAKAVLEYAAEKAWLYFLDTHNGNNVYGIDYQGIEGHQSFEDLIQKHEGGKSHAIDHGRERVDKAPNVPPIIDTMIHELRQKNIFAVQGIMKRLQEKAKFSHSNTWMLTTLLMLIRDESENDPTLKLCLDQGMIDNIANFTITQSAWSLTWLKLNRHDIEKWKHGDDFGNNETTRAMERIEEMLEASGAKFDVEGTEKERAKARLTKYEAIAMVLSGKTLHEGNKEAEERGVFKYGWNSGAVVSLFGSDSILTEYRKKFKDVTGSTDTEAGDTDSDYFNPKNGGSDIMLLEESQVSKILSRKSTGEWTYESKARGFVTQVLMRYDELEKLDPDAFQNFKEEMRKKFDYCLNGVWDKGRRPTVVTDTDLQGNNMVDQLASRQLLSDASIGILASDKPSIRSARKIPMKL